MHISTSLFGIAGGCAHPFFRFFSGRRRKHFSLFMHLSFFRTQPVWKRNMSLQRCWELIYQQLPFKKTLSFLLLSTWINILWRVSALWFCSTSLFHCKAQSDTSNCGIKLTAAAAAESFRFDIYYYTDLFGCLHKIKRMISLKEQKKYIMPADGG